MAEGMLRRILRSHFFRPCGPVLAVALCLLMLPAAKGAGYDISYVWRQDLAAVKAYRKKVAYVLGPAAADRLRLVREAGGFGLVYLRGGSRDSTAEVAKAHSRLLKAAGLQPAEAVHSRDWARADPGPAPQAAARSLTGLEKDIEDYVGELRRQGLIRADERTAWIVYDISSDRKLAGINEDVPMESASLIKPFIALAWFHEVEAGRRKYGAVERGHMENMIQESDNRAADWFMRRLGGPAAAQSILKRNYGGLLRDTKLVEYIPADGRTYRNKASVHDYSRFLYALWNGSLPRSAEIKRLMNLPKPNRLYTSAPGVPEGTEVYDKTGTTSRLCGDMGILVARRPDGRTFPYIVAGVIQKSNPASSYGDWMRSRGDVIRHVSEMAYEAVSGSHAFADYERSSAKKAFAQDGGKEKSGGGSS